MKTIALILLCLLSSGALAWQAADRLRQTYRWEAECNWLMTDRECAEHEQRLRTLTEPVALHAYLRQHQALLRERADLCTCNPGPLKLAGTRHR